MASSLDPSKPDHGPQRGQKRQFKHGSPTASRAVRLEFTTGPSHSSRFHNTVNNNNLEHGRPPSGMHGRKDCFGHVNSLARQASADPEPT
jgi:hypothetical protein